VFSPRYCYLPSLLVINSKTNKDASKFDKYKIPAHITELDHRFTLANMAMVRNLTPMHDGISIPEVWGLSDDDSHVIVRVFVSEKDLPSRYDSRKNAFEETATGAAAMVTAQFNAGIHLNDIIVEFMSIEGAVHNSNKDYAIYKNGELTFH